MTCKRQILNIYYATVSLYEDTDIEVALSMVVQITDFSYRGGQNLGKKKNNNMHLIHSSKAHVLYFLCFLSYKSENYSSASTTPKLRHAHVSFYP